MQSLLRQPLRCLAVVVLLLPLFAGCAGVGQNSTSESAEKVATAASVSARLQNGREGFLIRETATLDGALRSDFDRATSLLAEGDFAKAIDLLEKVVAHSPGVTAPYINLAIAYKASDQREPAEKQLQAALKLVPFHPVASNEYGLLCREAGRFDEARTLYQNALKAYPDYLPLRRNLGILCDLYLNDPTCALEQYEIYSKAMPEDAQVQMWVGDLRMRLGQ